MRQRCRLLQSPGEPLLVEEEEVVWPFDDFFRSRALPPQIGGATLEGKMTDIHLVNASWSFGKIEAIIRNLGVVIR